MEAGPMEHVTSTLFFEVMTLVIAVCGQTAIFVWRIVAMRDAVIGKIDVTKAALDLEVDMLRREIGAFQLHVAENYMRKVSFNDAMSRFETGTQSVLEKIESRLIRLDERVTRVIEKSRMDT